MNALTVLNFIQENTLARQNIFSANIKIPILGTLDATVASNQLIEYYIQNISLPSSNLTLAETSILGKIKYSVLTQVTDSINVTFYDTEALIIRSLFMNYLDNITDNSRHQILQYYPNQYQTDIDFKIHDKDFRASGCTPINVGDFVLDYENTNSIGTFTVTFKTKYVKEV